MLKELTLRDDGTCDRNGKTEDRLQKSFFSVLCSNAQFDLLIPEYLQIVED